MYICVVKNEKKTSLPSNLFTNGITFLQISFDSDCLAKEQTVYFMPWNFTGYKLKNYYLKLTGFL